MLKKHRIVILGGGFGGIYAALNLRKKFKCSEVEILIVDERNYFLFTPLLHEVATATIDEKVAVESIGGLVKNKEIDWKVGKVTKLLFKEKKVVTSDFKIEYDYLVIALGSCANTYNIIGVEENAFFLKNLPDAIKLKHSLIERFQKAAVCDTEFERKKMLTFSIVGAGPTGIELAGEILNLRDDLCKHYFNSIKRSDVTVNLLNSGESILPNNDPKLGKWVMKYLENNDCNVRSNCRVVEVKPETLKFSNGEILASGLIIWTAGVKPNVFEHDGGLEFEEERISVDKCLRVKGVSDVYAIGDVAAGAPMLAQAAVQQAKVVANNLYSQIANIDREYEFVFRQKGFLVSVGKWKAVGEVFGVPVKGFMVWLLWHMIYLFKFLSNSKRMKVLMDWILHVFRSRDISSY